MYICQCCGGRFETPVLWRESRGEYFGYPVYEEVLGCPYCGGSYENELLRTIRSELYLWFGLAPSTILA